MIKIAQYKIKAEKIEEVLETIREFINNIKKSEPTTTYNAFQLEDKVSFIHFMSFQSSDEEEKHKAADYTRVFVEKLYPNCIEDPAFTDLTQVD